MEKESIHDNRIYALPEVITELPWLEKAQELMNSERLSSGGNIRDKTLEDLVHLKENGGQIWACKHDMEILSVCTLEPIVGKHNWLYINNGVTKPTARGYGLSGQLVASAVQHNEQPDILFFALYVRQGLFERLGFREISQKQLAEIDPIVGNIVANKIRPDKPAHIFVRTGMV
jgi:hypothetical protein